MVLLATLRFVSASLFLPHELEIALLDVLQQRVEFTPRQLLYLEYLEKVLTLPRLSGS